MAKTSLPPGFRFHPTDVELTVYYLKRKLLGKHLRCNAITEIDLYKFAPWDLPDDRSLNCSDGLLLLVLLLIEKASLESNDLVWYFFCPRDRKYSSGLRTNRSTGVGYWKATGKDRPVVYNSRTVGMKRTLVFHLGKPPRGDRTDWVMYEYRLEDEELAASGVKLDACVLCKIFQKSGPGPKIGAQYGAPFNEEDWNDASNLECSPLPPSVAPCAPESSQGGLNSAGQHLAVSCHGKVYLSPFSESSDEHAVNHVHPDRPSPNIPIDSIHIQLLTEIIRCSSTNHLCTAAEDDSLPDSTAGYDNEDGVSLDDIETIFCEVDELASRSVVDNSNHCDLREHLIHPMLEARGTEHYLELNDLSFSLADGSDSCGMLLSNDISVEHPFDLGPRFEQDSLDYISNTVNTSTSTTAGSFPSVPAVDEHRM
ncbi:NAC domain-containing protein 82 [Dichanthelium oligosanthes]|uniref:NAC domain-containing protein 82 n=1 Tax=Dichanthelium oligosanthes TaxID=888268 RepID=A0A1E5VR86_9POAL|nr:NAC domain-containing protein 82 [Dichanthelium oligosanthes]